MPGRIYQREASRGRGVRRPVKGQGEFTFTSDDIGIGDTTVYFQISQIGFGTALEGQDYTLAGATPQGGGVYAVTIPDSSGEATVEITPIDTGAVGGSESVVLDLVPGQGYDVDNDSSTATVTIFNNDLPSVSIVADEPDATGLSGPGEFTVTRNGPTGEPLLVNYSIGGTATNGQDYQTIPGDVVIPAGSSTAAIPIDPLYVGSTSGSTTVVLTLAAGLGYSIADPAPSDTVTIEDNSDPQAPPASEFYIGLGGTYAVPAGATTLYLGLHDGFDWTDNQGTVSAELTWNVGGEVNESVPATACRDFAFAPSGLTGPQGENVDADRPIEVSVPEGATSVTITASGTWSYKYPDDPGNGPDGVDPPDILQTSSAYRTETLHSENIILDTCNLASLEGMWTPVTPPPTLAVHDTVAVAGDNETFTVTLSQAVDYTVTVPYSTQNGSAHGRHGLHGHERHADLLAG